MFKSQQYCQTKAEKSKEVAGVIESFMGDSEGWSVCNNPAPVAEVCLMTNHPHGNGLTASPSQGFFIDLDREAGTALLALRTTLHA